MDFIAIDLETANADMSSICQIGIVCYKNEQIINEWKSYIDPEDFFDSINISIHGIDESTVKNSPTLPEVAYKLHQFLDNNVSICHTHFDRVSLAQACEKYNISKPNCTWLDSARVARRTWSQFAWKGYGLHNICSFIGYEFHHHDALEDAKAAGRVIIAAIKETGLTIEEWFQRVEQPIDLSKKSKHKSGPIRCDGNPDGPLYGEVLVFTGALEIPRRDATTMAANVGCYVASGVTKKTTILVVGDQDIKRLAGHKRSSKHRKVETLISQGQDIRILRETDFKKLVKIIQ